MFLGKKQKKNKQKQIKMAKTKKQKFKYGCKHTFWGSGFLNVLKIYKKLKIK